MAIIALRVVLLVIHAVVAVEVTMVVVVSTFARMGATCVAFAHLFIHDEVTDKKKFCSLTMK